jgi:predicted dehydrogenase
VPCVRLGVIGASDAGRLTHLPAMAYRIGIIGTGRVAQEHARAIRAIGGEIAVVYDVDIEKARQFVRDHASVDTGVPSHQLPVASDTLDDLLAMRDVPAVVVAVPNVVHRDVAVAALSAGKDVLLEKPMAMNVGECDDIIACRDRSGRLLQMGFVCRYAPRVKEVQRLISSGELGAIYHAKATMIRKRGIPGLGRWFTTKAQSGGGVLIDIGVHLIDLVMHLTGRARADRVSGVCESRFGSPIREYVYEDMWAGPPDLNGVFDVEDSVCGLVRFPNGLSMELNITWAANVPDTLYRDGILLLGDRGGCFFDLWADQFIVTRQRDRNVADFRPRHDNTDAWTVAWNNQHAAFRDCLEKRIPPTAAAEAGRSVQAIVDAMYESAAVGREVAVTP